MSGSNIDRLWSRLNNGAKDQVKVQTCWVVAGAVDWQEKTMTAKGVSDDLEYFDISLGLGSFFRKPKTGTICLIGLIENQDAATFLIDAEDVEEFSISSGDNVLLLDPNGWSFNGGQNGGLVNWPKALTEFNKTKAVVDTIASLLQNWVPVASDGGAALQLAAKAALGSLKTGTYSNLEDTKVKH
jgi:hypothetical protein